jgi:glycosyltransferase involved in cell wall biosynthesis
MQLRAARTGSLGGLDDGVHDNPRQMRILILTQHFAPEVTAARARVEAFAAGLAAREHEVEVICAVPNHPEGIVHPEFRHRAIVRAEQDGYRVKYVWVRASPKKSVRNRLLLYATFAASATLAGALTRRPDVVLASSPPLPVGAAAAAVAARHRVPWVLDVRDLWPEAAVALGELPDGRAARAAERLERWLYKSAAAITTVTAPFCDDITERGVDADKVTLIPNGTTRQWLDAGELDADRVAADLPGDRFVWAYGGNLGLAQGLDAAIDAAADLGSDYQLLLIGDGPLRSQLEERAAELPDGLVDIRGLVQPDVAARTLRAADALLVPLDARPALRKFVPSKLFDCAALGRPVIVSAAGEASRIAAEAGAGLTVPPSDPVALADAVRALRDDPALRDRLSAAGRELARAYLRDRGVDRLDALLRSLA